MVESITEPDLSRELIDAARAKGQTMDLNSMAGGLKSLKTLAQENGKFDLESAADEAYDGCMKLMREQPDLRRFTLDDRPQLPYDEPTPDVDAKLVEDTAKLPDGP